jgi:hypothetical protein
MYSVQCTVCLRRGRAQNFMQIRELEAPVNYEISCRSCMWIVLSRGYLLSVVIFDVDFILYVFVHIIDLNSWHMNICFPSDCPSSRRRVRTPSYWKPNLLRKGVDSCHLISLLWRLSKKTTLRRSFYDYLDVLSRTHGPNSRLMFPPPPWLSSSTFVSNRLTVNIPWESAFALDIRTVNISFYSAFVLAGSTVSAQAEVSVLPKWYQENYCSVSRWRPQKVDKRMVLEYTHGLFIT